MKLIQVCSTLLLLLTFSSLLAQVKYEKEYRLDPKLVPDSALRFVAELSFSKRIKWYKEEGLENVSIEAKTKSKRTGQKYSIEFSKEGAFEDVEIEIKWSEMPLLVQHRLCTYLDTSFKRYKIQKVQVQFTGTLPAVKNKIKMRSIQPSTELNTHYELIAKVEKEGNYYQVEFLFNQEGDLVRQSILLSKNTDNLEY